MQKTSILLVAHVFQKAACEVISRSCSMEVTVAKTAQIIPSIEISKDIGAFVTFSGNYSGVMVINFTGDAALELVTSSLVAMGMPEEDIPSHHLADDVLSSIGELTNHIIGKARADMKTEYDLVAHANIPAVVPVTAPIGLVFKGNGLEGYSCIRLAFSTPQNHHFHMEITLEPALFEKLPE